MDLKSKRLVPGSQGTAASNERLDWFAKASSFQMGANCDTASIRAESRENNLKFGTPDEDNLPNPADSNGDADATLKNPHNFSNNPGFLGTSTGSALQIGAPRSGVGIVSGAGRARQGEGVRVGGPVVGRSPSPGRGSVGMPAPGDTDPISEGSPMGRTTGRSGA